MFKYRCSACGATGLSSPSYSTVGICPACGAALAREASVRVPEPDPVSWAEQRDAWLHSGYHEIALGPPVGGGSKMGVQRKALVKLGRWRVQAAEAIDVARWQLERQRALKRGRPWPPQVRSAPAPVTRRRRAAPAVTPTRAFAVAALLLALLAVGAALQEPDDRNVNARPAKVGAVRDAVRPGVAAAMPQIRDAAAHKGDEVLRAAEVPHTSAESRREGRARTKKRERRELRSSERERDRVASRAVSGGRPSAGRSPAAQAPATSAPGPVAQQPAGSQQPTNAQPATPTPVATAPAPAEPVEAPTADADEAETPEPHPHGGPPGHGGDRGGSKKD